MNKQQEAQADSVSTVGVSVKDYAPSDVFTEPPPAYMKPKATAVQIAKIIAFTVITCSFILGSFMLAAAYVQANASCSQLLQAEALLHQQNDDGDHPSYQALVDPLQSEESMDSKQESSVHTPNSIQEPPQKREQPPSLSQTREREQAQQQSYFPQGQQSQQQNQQTQSDNGLPIQIKLPLQLDFDDLAASLLEKNQRSRMNCVVEKRRAEEVMDHKPKMVRLPFGVNLTTDPRYEHVTGERMAIFCESGQDARHTPMESMPQPIVVPVPMGHPIPMNMPMGGHGPSQHGPYMGPNVPMMSPHMPHPMMGQSQPNMMMNPNMQAMNQMGPQPHYHGPYQGPMMGPHSPQPHQPHHSHAPPHVNQIPISIFTKLQQDDASSQRQSGEDQPITIIAREEQVIPIFQAETRPASNGGQISAESRVQQNSEERTPMQSVIAEARLVPEARALLAEIPEDRSIPVPAEMVRPPPPMPSFREMPVPMASRMNVLQEDNVPEQDERPHYVQPRSVRSTDSVLKREKKRVRRGTCECLLH